MQFKEALEKLHHSQEFKDWHHNGYLVHGFIMINDGKIDFSSWQIGYYDQKSDRITPFQVGEHIQVGAAAEVFKEEKTIVELDVEKVKITAEQALEKAQKIKKEYGEQEDKILFVLQHLKGFGNVWNITFVTTRMNTINVKVDAETGNVKEHKLSSLLDFTAKK